MTARDKIKAQRLIHGEIRRDDISDLLLFAREHHNGRQSLYDIGGFIAHYHKRDKGLICESVNNWLLSTEHYAHLLAASSLGIPQPPGLPAISIDYLRTAAKIFDPKKLKNQTGFNQKDAHRILNRICDEAFKIGGERYFMPFNISNKEKILVDILLHTLVVRPAFDSKNFTNDFLSVLTQNSIITKNDTNNYGAKISRIANLYAITIMHNSLIKTKCGPGIKLAAGINTSGGNIGVYASSYNHHLTILSKLFRKM